MSALYSDVWSQVNKFSETEFTIEFILIVRKKYIVYLKLFLSSAFLEMLECTFCYSMMRNENG